MACRPRSRCASASADFRHCLVCHYADALLQHDADCAGRKQCLFVSSLLAVPSCASRATGQPSTSSCSRHYMPCCPCPRCCPAVYVDVPGGLGSCVSRHILAADLVCVNLHQHKARPEGTPAHGKVQLNWRGLVQFRRLVRFSRRCY